MLRVAFAGTPDFAVPTIEALLSAENIVLDCIYTQPDRPSGRGQKPKPSAVKLWAEQYNLPVRQPDFLGDSKEINWLKAKKLDAMVVVAYGQLLGKKVLTATRLGCFNLHGSLLPRWRGAAPLQRAIESGDSETGVSIILMDEGLDTGPILSRLSFPLTNSTTSEHLHSALSRAGASLLVDTLIRYEKGFIKPEIQEKLGVTYAHKISTAQAEINWNADFSAVMRHVHAFNPTPGAFTFANDCRIKIFCVEKTTVSHPGQHGILWSDRSGRALVSTTSAVLELAEIQLPGKKRITKKQIQGLQNAPWLKAIKLKEPQP